MRLEAGVGVLRSSGSVESVVGVKLHMCQLGVTR